MSPENIREKIRKLLALSNSDNPHEAALAAERAQALILQFNVSQDELKDPADKIPDEPVEVEAMGGFAKDGKKTRIPHWQPCLALHLAKAFMCRIYYQPGYDIFMVGRRTNRDALRMTWIYLRNEIERMAEVTYERTPEAQFTEKVTWKRAFCEGATSTVFQRMSAEVRKLEIDTTKTAIVLRSRMAEVEKFMEKIPLRTAHAPRRPISNGFREGQQAGHSLNLKGKAARGLPSTGT
jgi:hypothetical protein